MPRGQYDREAARLRKEGRGPDAVAPILRIVPAAPAEPPTRVCLKEAHGFINEYGAVYFRPQGAVITNPIEIAMLVARGAPIEEI